MFNFMPRFADFYRNSILNRPKISFLVASIIVALVSLGAYKFELDASAESLVLENDQDLVNYRTVAERFGSSETLIVTFTPPWPLFSEQSLSLLKSLRDELKVLPRVESVNSLLDVPLLENPPVPVVDLLDNIKSLESPDVNVKLAKLELINSPLYNNMLLNLDQNTTAIQINRPFDQAHRNLTKSREDLWDKRAAESLSSNEKIILERLNNSIKQLNAYNAQLLHEDIKAIRQVLVPYKHQAEIYLGGVPMIADDMISFVESDMYTFGIGVFVFLVFTLLFLFRRIRWVFIALACCTLTVTVMIGILGLFNWRVTVISSNFASLLLIMTMSMCIHLIVRYKEAYADSPDATQKELVKETINHMFKPCFYMALTTMVAFNSLIFSGIRPVIDFGWMMATGVMVALVLVFVFFPIFLLIFGKRTESISSSKHSSVTNFFAWLTLRHSGSMIAANVVLAVVVLLGLGRLEVENSFIDYFDKSTEIYQGMKVIDQRLGGTTPLEVIINFPELDMGPSSTTDFETDGFEDDGFEDDGFGEDGFGEEATPEDLNKYWFTAQKVKQITKVHQFLDRQPEIGKVTSLSTMVQVAEKINGEPLGSFELALLYSAIPPDFKAIVLDPYASPEHNQARVSMRIYDTLPNLKRAELLQRIETGLQEELGLEEDEYMIAGMMVLYNNMLQSLFTSQILTLGAVFIGIMLMFTFLFQSWKVAAIALVPNLLSAGAVLSVMGWAGIPLDMMTITIAAITIGIAVDDTIHYIHRLKEEFAVCQNYKHAIKRCHDSIGKAVYYTSLTVVVGFSILTLSNFIPTIYFGLLTGMAMLIALVQVLTLLPGLFIVFKPLGPEVEGTCSEMFKDQEEPEEDSK
jgi:predicted RND superfamily exporter protein